MQMRRLDPTQITRLLYACQSLFYVITGVWPLLSINTFQRVTGPKVDLWLVKTAGVLITVIGTALGIAAARQQDTPETRLLAAGSALGLTAIDVVYVTRKRIAKIYLLDAAAEVVLVLLLVASWLFRRQAHRLPAAAKARR